MPPSLESVRELFATTSRRLPVVPPGGRAPRVAILGAGFGGLCAAIRLREAGLTSFTIYEKSDGVGGTWRDNTYPGAGCDVPSHLYSFSFAPNTEWSRHYSPQDEILAYIERCADEFGIRPHLRTSTEVTALRWDDDAQVWHLRTAAGDEAHYDVVVSGLGQLNRPAVPDLPGLDEFAGTTFHSARWNHDHDLAGRRVAVIGNGASALQFIPRVAAVADHLTVLQRSANWVLPRRDRDFAETTKQALRAVPGLEQAYRALIYWSLEARFVAFQRDSRLEPLIEKAADAYRRATVHDPELAARLRPDYPVGCKRILISDDYYQALDRDDVDVVTEPIDRITLTGIRTAGGILHPVDTIIFATGFRSTEFLAPVEVTGRGGVRLADRWAEGAEAYLGLLTAGFPNLFVLYGPNTNLGHNSILFMLECQVHYVLSCLRHLGRQGLATVEVRPEVEAAFNDEVQEAMHRTVWEAGCDNWYKTADGKVVNNWPDFTCRYWLRTRRPRWDDLVLTPRRSPAPVPVAT